MFLILQPQQPSDSSPTLHRLLWHGPPEELPNAISNLIPSGVTYYEVKYLQLGDVQSIQQGLPASMRNSGVHQQQTSSISFHQVVESTSTPLQVPVPAEAPLEQWVQLFLRLKNEVVPNQSIFALLWQGPSRYEKFIRSNSVLRSFKNYIMLFRVITAKGAAGRVECIWQPRGQYWQPGPNGKELIAYYAQRLIREHSTSPMTCDVPDSAFETASSARDPHPVLQNRLHSSPSLGTTSTQLDIQSESEAHGVPPTPSLDRRDMIAALSLFL